LYVNVVGELPAIVRAVVPRVSVITPELLSVISLPFASVVVAAPVPEAVAGTNKPPLLGVTVTFALTSTDIVYPEPSVARACTAPVTWQPSFSHVMLKGCPTP
jgi:hypothetical protein